MRHGRTRGVLSLSALTLASANRGLLNKPAGGALHAVVLPGVDPLSYTTGLPPNQNLVLDLAPANTIPTSGASYYATNGNGTWSATYDYTFSTGVYGGYSIDGCGSYSAPTGWPAFLDSTYYVSGLTAVTFPSRSLGVAVGLGKGYAAGAAAASPQTCDAIDTRAAIYQTTDAQTWMAVSSMPAVTEYIGDDGTISVPYPPVTPGDLTNVYFANKMVGWAVGGNCIGYGLEGTTVTAGASPMVPVGVILMTTTGATTWTYAPLMYTYTQASAAQTADNAASKTLFAQPIPGILYGITSDAAGKNVWAVGSPFTTGAFASGVVTYDIGVVPTILYSGNSGASWVMQTAPALNQIGYSLFSVAAKSGSTAWAVGGRLTDDQPALLHWGTILGTSNGGFSWTAMSFPGAASANVPQFTSVAVNGNSVWVGGKVLKVVSGGSNTVCYPSGTIVATTNPCVSYSLLVSTDGKNFRPAAASSTFPAGFVGSAADSSKGVFGIQWDNKVRGFIYGGFGIMGTQDGGATWAWETPNGLTTTKGALVRSLAVVPTTY